MSDLKERRIVLELKLQADDMTELSNALYMLSVDIDRMDEPDIEHHSTSGGYTSGYHFELRTNKDMTGDKYREWLEQWRQERIKQRREAAQ